jgi:hypothetical protein
MDWVVLRSLGGRGMGEDEREGRLVTILTRIGKSEGKSKLIRNQLWSASGAAATIFVSFLFPFLFFPLILQDASAAYKLQPESHRQLMAGALSPDEWRRAHKKGRWISASQTVRSLDSTWFRSLRGMGGGGGSGGVSQQLPTYLSTIWLILLQGA